MEEPKDNQTSSQPPAPNPAPQRKGVMDIQPPQPPAQPAKPDGLSPEVVAEPPAEDAPKPSNELHNPPNQQEGAAEQATPETSDKPQMDTLEEPKLPGHGQGKKAPRAVIVVAVIVALGLIGLTVFAYMKTQEETPTDTNTSESSDESNGAAPATVDDVDAASKEVDEALKGTDEEDFSESDLTDQSLGL